MDIIYYIHSVTFGFDGSQIKIRWYQTRMVRVHWNANQPGSTPWSSLWAANRSELFAICINSLIFMFPRLSRQLQAAGSLQTLQGRGPILAQDVLQTPRAETEARWHWLGSQSYRANISFPGNSVFNPIMNDAWLEASEGVLPSFVWCLVSDNTGCLLLSPGRVHVSLCGPARVICIHQRVNWLRHSWHRVANRERRF